jgi:predicted MFS family arabinose efflux permease
MLRARRATSAIFLVCGTATSTWAPMVPFAKDRLGLDEAALGLILLALGGGSIVAMPLAGVAIHYWGSRPVIVAATVVACAALPLLAAAATPLLLACTLFAFGAGLGTMDVAMNAQAIVVQHAARRPIMSGFHALFSVGGLVGAGLVTIFLWVPLSLATTALMIATGLLVLGLSQVSHFLPDRGESAGSSFTLVPSRRVLLLGILCFISFLAEGAILDWSAVFLREIRGMDISIAGIGYAGFSVTMVAGRLTGDAMTHRFGVQRILRNGGSLAVAGFVIAAAVPSAAGALCGFLLFGIGVANIVPVLFSAAGHVPGVPAGVALATVTTIAYAGLLVGPALIGFIADATSLPAAFIVVAGMLAAIPLSAGRVRYDAAPAHTDGRVTRAT